jgi:hypothetical protein
MTELAIEQNPANGFADRPNLNSVLRQLQKERKSLAPQLERLNSAISALNGTGGRGAKSISAPGRARIAAAQRARWAKAWAKWETSLAESLIFYSKPLSMSRAEVNK